MRPEIATTLCTSDLEGLKQTRRANELHFATYIRCLANVAFVERA